MAEEVNDHNKFAAECLFIKEGEDIAFLEGNVVSEIPYIEPWIEYDVFRPNVLEDDNFKKLPDGQYHVYMTGEVWFESDIDRESGVEEGSYVFVAQEENITYVRLGEVKTEDNN